MVPAGEALADEICQDATGAHLDERARARLPHRFNLFDEPDGLRNLAGERGPHVRSVAGVGLSRCVGVHRDPRHTERDGREELGEGDRRWTDDLGMKGGGHLEEPRGHAGRAESLGCIGDGGDVAGERDLVGGVVVGDDHRKPPVRDQPADLLDGRRHRAHRAVGAGCRLRHQHTPRPRDPEGKLLAEDAGSAQGADLAEAVSADGNRRNAQSADHRQQAQAVRADARLRPLGFRQVGRLLRALVVGERRLRPDDLVQVSIGVQVLGAATFPRRQSRLEKLRDLGPHADVLAALPGEQQCDRPGFSRRIEIAFRGTERGCEVLTLKVRGGVVELCAQVRDAVGNDRQVMGLRGVVGGLRAVRKVAEHVVAVDQRSRQASGVLGERRRGGRAEHHQLGIPGTVTERAPPAAGVLLDGDVEVGPAEAERADRRAPRDAVVGDPRLGSRRKVERCPLDVEGRVGLLDFDGRRQRPVMQRHHGLEQAAGPRRPLGVPDLGLDGAQCAPLVVFATRFLENLAQSGELSGITGFGARAVCLDQPHRVGTVAGGGIGAAEGFGLTGGTWCVDALRAAIRGRANAPDDGVDPVGVALGVIETLEREHGEPLAQHRAVGVVGEGAAVSGGRHGGDCAETHEHIDVVAGVDSAGDHHVRLAEIQLVEPDLQGGQGACAGRVDDAVRTPEVEAVGDPARDDISEKSGKGVLLPRRVVRQHSFAESLDLPLWDTGGAQGPLPDRLLEPTAHVAE